MFRKPFNTSQCSEKKYISEIKENHIIFHNVSENPIIFHNVKKTL